MAKRRFHAQHVSLTDRATSTVGLTTTTYRGEGVTSSAGIGAVCFGLVVGWMTYRTLVRRTDNVALSHIATVIGAIGGAAVVALFNDKQQFGLYSIGLAVGFFGYLSMYRSCSARRGDR
jgi:hypothetical protein